MDAREKSRELLDKVADTKFAKDVLGPKVIKPVSEWYEDSVVGGQRSASTEPAADVVIQPRQRTANVDPASVDGDGGTVDLTGASAAVRTRTDKAMGDAPAGAEATIDLTQPTGAAATASVTDPALAKDAARNAKNEKKRAAKKKGAVKPPSRFKRMVDTFQQAKLGIKKHNLVVVAAGIAFWGLLAIPAVLTAALSIYGMVAEPDEVESQISDNLSGAPDEVQTIISEQLEGVAGASGGSLAVGAVIGLLLALWTSSGAMAKLLATFNTIWDVEETRKFPKLRGTALLLTFGGIAFIGAAAFLLAIMPAVLDSVGLGDVGRWILNIARFPALLVVMAIGLAVLYWMGPNRKRSFKAMTPGAITATVLWVLISGAFSVYTASFASYNETYGALGGLVILLLWLFITAFMVLFGAEIEAANEGVALADD